MPVAFTRVPQSMPAAIADAHFNDSEAIETLVENTLAKRVPIPAVSEPSVVNPAPRMVRHTVVSGDTLGKIAGRHRCVSVQELAAMNNIRPPRYTIRVGQTIKIPGCS